MSDDGGPKRIWVMDTSSILSIKHRIQPKYRPDHLTQLTKFINSDLVVCPPQVVKELTEVKKPDQYSAWAKNVKQKACRFGGCQHMMLTAMAERAVAQCIEHLESNGSNDPADPWVIAHALHLRDEKGLDVTVVTDERAKYKKARASLNIAAGALNFPAINYETMVAKLGTWDDAHLLP